ncbi:MAG: hypothetical protein HY677_03225 [Chloroflexi bacterium]|nr:hypothetical protein [Chloroflexota bacterium]
MKAPNIIVAEMWKELLENEGVTARILPDPEKPGGGDDAPRLIYVPRTRIQVAEEVTRNI